MGTFYFYKKICIAAHSLSVTLGSLQKETPNIPTIKTNNSPHPLATRINQTRHMMGSTPLLVPQAHWQNQGIQGLVKEYQRGGQSNLCRNDVPKEVSHHGDGSSSGSPQIYLLRTGDMQQTLPAHSGESVDVIRKRQSFS